MTHFTVGIIVPEDKLPDILAFICKQMEPYNENTRVEPYVCYSIEEAKAEIERDIARLGRIIEQQSPDYNLDKCRDILAGLRTTIPEQRYSEYVQYHELFNVQGEPLSTSNPDSKWDWFVIGGRWDGWITGNEQSSDHGLNFGPQHQTIENNIATTEQAVERDVIPHAIITPDGEWHEHGQMGWWGIMITENEGWDAQTREILTGYPGHHLLILDAHI
jgi:hypothetical protein